MRRTLDGWLDTLLLIIFLGVGTAMTAVSIARVSGLQADLGKDKVTAIADHVVYEDVPYTVKDFLLTCVSVDKMGPEDFINVTYGSNTVSIDMSVEDVYLNKYATASKVMSLKPSSMSTEDWYALTAKVELVVDSAQNTYTYNVTIGG